MPAFLDDDLFLSTPTARRLYHQTAAGLPILDYHCHLDPRQIAEDHRFATLTEVWLDGDHYKWRLMRAAGVPERLVTGDASDWERFYAFAEIMPLLPGNPVYQWCHLELRRVFGITAPLSAQTARAIYDEANEKLAALSARALMRRFRVRAVCTTDDPADDLRWHAAIAADPGMEIRVLPTFRPDGVLGLQKPGFAGAVRRLGAAVGHPLESTADVIDALARRMDVFDAHGCLCADHGLDQCVFAPPEMRLADEGFRAALAGQMPTPQQAAAYQTALLLACARQYARRDWVMQIHFGCLRNINKRAVAAMGPDHGHDAVNSQSGVNNLAGLLNAFVENDGLPKMILYSLDPGDNTAIDAILACFQGEEGGAPGRLQHGSAWWFNDSRPGMRAQLTALAANGVLGRFVGMLTDSRSFLSYTRHEYFRRVLCELLGEWVESGQYPDDGPTLNRLVEDICFTNTDRFFGFGAAL